MTLEDEQAKLAAAFQVPLERLFARTTIRYDAEGYEKVKACVLNELNVGYDPYNNPALDPDAAEVFCNALSAAHSLMVEPMWKAIHRWETQHFEAGYDPYNNQRRRVTLFVQVPPHATRKP